MGPRRTSTRSAAGAARLRVHSPEYRLSRPIASVKSKVAADWPDTHAISRLRPRHHGRKVFVWKMPFWTELARPRWSRGPHVRFRRAAREGTRRPQSRHAMPHGKLPRDSAPGRENHARVGEMVEKEFSPSHVRKKEGGRNRTKFCNAEETGAVQTACAQL